MSSARSTESSGRRAARRRSSAATRDVARISRGVSRVSGVTGAARERCLRRTALWRVRCVVMRFEPPCSTPVTSSRLSVPIDERPSAYSDCRTPPNKRIPPPQLSRRVSTSPSVRRGSQPPRQGRTGLGWVARPTAAATRFSRCEHSVVAVLLARAGPAATCSPPRADGTSDRRWSANRRHCTDCAQPITSNRAWGGKPQRQRRRFGRPSAGVRDPRGQFRREAHADARFAFPARGLARPSALTLVARGAEPGVHRPRRPPRRHHRSRRMAIARRLSTPASAQPRVPL
jgi:hypothetical protein